MIVEAGHSCLATRFNPFINDAIYGTIEQAHV